MSWRYSFLVQNMQIWDFPGGAVDKNLSVQGSGFHPWSGKIPHAWEQLSLCATTAEPCFSTKTQCSQKKKRKNIHTAENSSMLP